MSETRHLGFETFKATWPATCFVLTWQNETAQVLLQQGKRGCTGWPKAPYSQPGSSKTTPHLCVFSLILILLLHFFPFPFLFFFPQLLSVLSDVCISRQNLTFFPLVLLLCPSISSSLLRQDPCVSWFHWSCLMLFSKQGCLRPKGGTKKKKKSQGIEEIALSQYAKAKYLAPWVISSLLFCSCYSFVALKASPGHSVIANWKRNEIKVFVHHLCIKAFSSLRTSRHDSLPSWEYFL